MKKYKQAIINGDFLCSNVTGIERLAIEITSRLDVLAKNGELGIVIPANAKTELDLHNITVYRFDRDVFSFPKWQQITLPLLVKKLNGITVDFGNSCSLLNPGITFLHDIYCRVHPEDFVEKREKFERFYFNCLYWIIALRAKKIISVSNYCREQIMRYYHVSPDRIQVIYSSYDHFKKVKSDTSVFDQFPNLSKGYFFSLGSLSKRKNIIWILKYAKKHPDTIFAISGKSLPTFQINDFKNNNYPDNIILLGYLDDGKVKALMERCKAFILPSYYEGFGLTPLEALSCGAKVVVADAASLPEIYGDAAYYIDPYNTNIDLDELIKKQVKTPDFILNKYSYDKSANELYHLIKDFIV